MPLSEPYGVWKCTMMKWHTVEARHMRSGSSHGYIMFWDDSTPQSKRTWGPEREQEWKEYKKDKTHKNMKYRIEFRSSAINVKSSGRDERIVYWTGDLKDQRIIKQLQGLEEKRFYNISDGEDNLVGIDFLRDRVIKVEDGIVRDWNNEGDNNDILDAWDNFFADAAPFDQTELYIFGEYYLPKEDGLHNVHMNQGNLPPYAKENGVGQDGCVIMKTPKGQWKYFFCGFAVQASETNNTNGSPTTKKTLADVASGESSETGGSGPKEGGDVPEDEDEGPGPIRSNLGVEIKSALINPKGADNSSPGNYEMIELINLDGVDISLKGWKVMNKAGASKKLPDVELPGNGGTGKYPVGPECSLGNNGGLIKVVDGRGSIVDSVVYDKHDAKPEDVWVKFL